MLNNKLSLPTVISVALLITACGAESMQPKTPRTAPLPNPGEDGQYEPRLPQPGPGDTRYLSLTVEPALRCNLKETPKFPFDKSKMLAQYRASLVELAACLERPDLTDTTVYLVGHADRRGTDDYNKKLASQRAEYVKSLLVSEGLSEDRIVTLSEGEQDAKGETPDYSYGYDRRVEVHVYDPDYGPGPSHEARLEPIGGR